ncbi:hypothetical protein HDU97_003735 [Phlyctochytrium planicorne]|nr:hypothetical protein HDU97_003735 [Phlyctochytrium planicorne]
MAPTTPTSNYDRTNFGLVASGFSLAYILKYGLILCTRKFRGTDLTAAIIMFCWLFYIVVQLVDLWTKRTWGPIFNFQWLISAVTILYSATLSAVLYISVIRCSALSGLNGLYRQIFDWSGFGMVIGVFLVRLIRTGFIFYQTSQSNTNATLSSSSTTMQIVTLMPTLFMRFLLDTWSLYQLYMSRVKFIKQAGSNEAFWIITVSLIIEFGLSILAIIVGMQEALNWTGDKLSFMDWLLFSWCLASWVEQRPLYMQIFGQQMTHTNSDGTQSGMGNSTHNGGGSLRSKNGTKKETKEDV